MRRREVIGLIASALVAPHVAFAQAQMKIAQVGFLGPAPAANYASRVEALKEALPNARRFGVLFTPTAPSHIPALEAAERAGRRLQVELRMVPVRSEGDLHDAFAKMAQDRVDGFLVISSSFTFSRRALLA